MTARHLAITMGDPAGIGPEIIVKAARRLEGRIASGRLRLMVIGSGAALERARAEFAPEIDIPEIREDDADWPPLCLVQAGPEGEPILPGRLSADAGRFAYLAIERGVRLALAERIGGIVTAPLNKEALNKGRHHYPRPTQMLAQLTRARGPGSLLRPRHTRRRPRPTQN